MSTPVAVLPAGVPANNPTAPVNTAGAGTVSAPTAPVNAAGAGTVSAPGAPELVMPLAPATGGGGNGTLTVAGDGNAPGGQYTKVVDALATISGTAIVEYPGSTERWTTDGASTRPLTGVWGSIYKGFISCPEATTLEALAPKANYTATGSQSTASQVQVFASGAWQIYWLYDENDGNPATSRWVSAADASNADQGAAVIPLDAWLYPNPRNGFVGFTGGLGAQWQAEDRWLWWLVGYNNNTSTGAYKGIGSAPGSAIWTPHGSAPGNYTVVGSGGLPIPSAIQPTGLPSAPTAPVNAAGSGTVSAPAVPISIQPTGLPSAPAAPSPVQP